MHSLSTRLPFRPHANGRAAGIAFVIGVHVLLVYGLATSWRHDVKIMTKVTTLLEMPQDELPQPQPKPPVKPENTTIKTVHEPVPIPATDPEVTTDTKAGLPVESTPDLSTPRDTIAPPAPATSNPTPTRPLDIGVACPHMVKPDMPRQAVLNGTTGTVRATAVIRGGMVTDVINLTGPRIFHPAVKAAMLQYRCEASAGEVSATQEFNFRMTD